jgi:nucleotide-binding universal stress UspA family protein
MFKKILVPLDGSETAEAILPFAREVAARCGADLLLVTAVAQVGVWDAALTLQVMEKEGQVAGEYLSEQAAKLGGNVKTSVLQGDAAEAILSEAEKAGADLIAISTHGRSGLRRFLFGSVATKLLEASSVPVLFLRPKEGEDKGAPGPVVKKILVPLDGSDVALSIMPTVEEFARAMGASLVLYHAVAPLAVYPGFEAAAVPALHTVTEELQNQAREILERTARDAKSRGIEATMIVAVDMAVDGILQAGEDAKVDLIAIATHGRGGLGRLVLGSVADGVVRRSADIPCLVIRATDGSS